MASVLLSERAHRTVLSTAVIFLVAGFAIGRGGLGWVSLAPDGPTVRLFAEMALLTILFLDAAGLHVGELIRAWRLPGRALLLGLPLTILGIAIAGRLLLGMTWIEALIVGAMLSPTDPVFVAAILERESVPLRLRRLLEIESGLNDGIALPIVTVLLAIASHGEVDAVRPLVEAVLGVGVGVAVPASFVWLEKRSFFAASSSYQPLAGIAIAATTFGVSAIVHANEFLAIFAAGVTLATIHPAFAAAVREVGRPIAEVVKLATLLVFGAMLTAPLLLGLGAAGFLFAAAALLAARPLALVLSLFGGGLSRKEWLAAAWFGPKGFASLLYALLMLEAGLPRGTWLFETTALVIVISILAHSSTDVPVARIFSVEERKQPARP